MAEVVVGVIKDNLLSLLTEEVNLLKDVHEEVEEIVNELSSIHSILQDADKRAETEENNVSDGVKSWVQELRDVAFKAEDAVTEYTHHMARQPRPDYQRSFVEGFQKIACFLPLFCSSLKRRHHVACQIEDIKKRLNRIRERGQMYGFVNSIQQGSTSTATQNISTLTDPRRASRYLKEDELVGIESARDKLVGVLLDESSRCTIIPMVGMGGLGKTTLAQQVYNHVKGRFQCHAWVQMPHPYKIEEILRTLIGELFKSTKASIPEDIQGELFKSTKASIPEDIHTMDEKELTDKLRDCLKGKKYLVIFDDVWKEDFWDDMEHALVDDKVGSRIMITTRNRQVAEFCGSFPAVHIHEMQCLPVEKAWELFCKRTFRPEGTCPVGLEKISGDIVEACKGLPLAIVVIAGLLSRRSKNINEWRRFHASLTSELENNVHLSSIIKILSLSYNELPYHLKSCFLYFGVFPRCHSIRNGRLIRQWIAAGFVNAMEGKTLEEVAQEYMNELINRSLVEARELDVTGKPRKSRVHDLLHEVILKKTKEVSFCQALSGRADHPKFKGINRHLSIMINSSNDDLQGIKFPHVHSVIVFREDETLNNGVPVFATNFKFLKVLDFEDAPRLYHLPDDIGDLFDLRYLSVRRTKVKMLPRSLEKLENLETLDVTESYVYKLPAAGTMKRLRKLRNIYAQNIEHMDANVFVRGKRGIKVSGGIGSLTALQKLIFIEVDREGEVDVLKELGNLIQLRTLGIYNVRSEDWRTLCGCVEKMLLLESLFVSSTSENEVVDLESMSSPAQFLRNINLRGRLEKLPQWFTQLQSTLVKLSLRYSKLDDDPLQVLQNMHNLLYLEISEDAYVGKQLHFKEGAFPKLKELYLLHLSRLHSLIIEETALPVLEELWIGPCPEMKVVPSGLQHLKMLKFLGFQLMPLEFMILQDFRSVNHVPRVSFRYKNDKREVDVMTLADLLIYRQNHWINQEVLEVEQGAGTSVITIGEQ